MSAAGVGAVAARVTRVDEPQHAAALAAHLLDPQRARPVVVVTTATGQSSPYIDLDVMEEAVSGLADLYLVLTGPATFALSAQLPPMTDVYGGAGRVYPVDCAWQTDPYASPLRFVWNAAQAPDSSDKLVADALGAAHAAGLLTARTSSASAKRAKTRGRVAQLYPPTRALVDLTGAVAAIWQELLVPGVALERTLAVGMAVEGELNDDGRLDVSASLRKPSAALADYAVNDVVLVRVVKLDDIAATVELYPRLRTEMSAKDVTGNSLDRLTSLISAGEILAVRVTARGLPDGRRWRLSMLDVDDDELPVCAPSLLPGGPPWLVPAVTTATSIAEPAPTPQPAHESAPEPEPPHVQEPESQPTQERVPEPLFPSTPELAHPAGDPAQDRETAGLRDQIRSLQLERERLAAEATDSYAQTQEQRRAADSARTSFRRERVKSQRLEKQLKSAKSQDRGREGVDGLFTDPEAQFRFEVDQAYAYRIPAGDKDHRPKRKLTLGPDFLVTLTTVDGVDRSKVVDVTVEVITDLVNDIPGRELHRLRQDKGGDSPPVIRASDAAQCMRASLQVGTPSARRLHYWKVGASIELSSVRVHDDTRP